MRLLNCRHLALGGRKIGNVKVFNRCCTILGAFRYSWCDLCVRILNVKRKQRLQGFTIAPPCPLTVNSKTDYYYVPKLTAKLTK